MFKIMIYSTKQNLRKMDVKKKKKKDHRNKIISKQAWGSGIREAGMLTRTLADSLFHVRHSLTSTVLSRIHTKLNLCSL